jgi:hypothetical protein
MEVKGIMACRVDVNEKDFFSALLERFGIIEGRRSYYSVDEVNGVRGIYCWKDTSYHGSSDWQPTLIHEGEEAIAIYEALKLLESKYTEYLDEKSKRDLGIVNTKKRSI